MRRCALPLAVAWLVALAGAAWVRASEPRHGLSVFGDLEYPPEFEHFGYVKPDAVELFMLFGYGLHKKVQCVHNEIELVETF